MSKMTELASGAITAVDTVTNRARRGRRNPSDRPRQMGLPNQPSFTRASSVWRGPCCPRLRRRRREAGAELGRSNGCEPEH
jgi:hypothetical protein